MNFKPLTLLFVLLAFVTACGPDYLRSDNLYEDDPGFTIDADAQIDDTVENRQVLDVLSRYRQAMIKKDFGTLKRLVSADYYDNSGTTDTTRDDYGTSELDELWEMMANHAENISYAVVVKQIEVDGELAYVDYEYEYAYQYKVGDKVTWDAGVELNRLSLRNQAGDWKITSGL